jgi:hypothetical protein
MAPRISIIIPTRERCDTLVWSLETCVTQDYDNLEILVSDNASADATREVVAAAAERDSRVRYVNPGDRLGMSDHWEFALSHIDRGHVGIIGDDDGVMPGGVTRMASILSEYAPDALVWPVFSYYWPGYVDPSLANCLTFPAHQPDGVVDVRSAEVLRGVSTFAEHVHRLPSLYWGIVAVSAVDRARDSHGRFLNSITPDIYSGVALASVTDRYLRVSRALTLSGESRHSNAAHQITGVGELVAESPSRRFLEENQARFHPGISYAPNIKVLTGEAILQASDHVRGFESQLDVKAMLSSALSDPEHLFNPLVQHQVEEALARTAELNGLSDWFEQVLRRRHRTAPVHFGLAAARNILRQAPLHPCPDDVSNIYQASLLANALLEDGSNALGPRLRDIGGRFTKFRRGVASFTGRRNLAR